MRKSLFKCNNCGLEVNLMTPVNRPCPNCGGEFIEDFESEILSIIGMNKKQQPTDWAIEREIQRSMPDIIAGFEKLLAEEANDER